MSSSHSTADISILGEFDRFISKLIELNGASPLYLNLLIVSVVVVD
jgi:hypothetical protein